METIERTILSVVTQAGNFKIRYHIQDGGSSDETLNLLMRWKVRLGSGYFPIQCENIEFSYDSASDNGMYDAIVSGFGKLVIPQNSFVTWINSDDLLMPGAVSLIQKIYQTYSKDEVSWVTGSAAILSGDCPLAMPKREIPNKVIKSGLCDGKHWEFFQQEGTFFRYWLWEKISPEKNIQTFKLAGDWNLWRLMAHHAKSHKFHWPLGVFRVRENQLSRVRFGEYMAEIESTLSSSTRLQNLQDLAADKNVVQNVVKPDYPSDALILTEISCGNLVRSRLDKLLGSSHSILTKSDKKTLQQNGKTNNGTLPKKIFIDPENFHSFTIAKKSHWQYFNDLDVDLFGKTMDPEKEQLKVYQDLFILSYITSNITKGSKILDVGGGKSRILEHLHNDYECWNVDKLDGVGNGPSEIGRQSYKLVQDYMGNFNKELPDNYFDFVFSISALEHVPQDSTTLFQNIIDDMNRVLKPGHYNLHLFDIILHKNHFWSNKFTNYIFDNVATASDWVSPDTMRADLDFYAMSEKAYNNTWFHTTGRPYGEHGQPSSLNILWRKD